MDLRDFFRMKWVVVSAALGVLSAMNFIALPRAAPAPQDAPNASRPAGDGRWWKVNRLPWGDPDLQGIWPSTEMFGVPFERPEHFGTRAVLNDQEFGEREAQTAKQAQADLEEFSAPRADLGGGVSPPGHWTERGRATRQASLIVDPRNGRLPSMTPDGARRAAAARSTYSAENLWTFNGPEDLGVYDRCITRGVLRSTLPAGYNMGIQIVQAPGLVAIVYEMIHETRTIPLDGRPHSRVRTYMGDPRGHWDGDTLVVETTSFNGRVGASRNGHEHPMTDALRLTERFTRIAEDTMRYEATVDDPETWTRPWTVSLPLRLDPGYGMHEYACHEGNYAMRNILSGARAAERLGR
jgi:hypothetical protein